MSTTRPSTSLGLAGELQPPPPRQEAESHVLDLQICQSGEGEAAVGKREPEEHQGGGVQGLLNAVDNVGQTALLPASIIGTPRWYCGPGQPHIGQGDGH